MSTLTCNHEIRPTGANLHLDPRQEFLAIDEYVRGYERQWVTVAQQCLRVKTEELWRHGPYHSWEDWINSAAPKSARTIFYHVGVVKDLAPDFSAEDMAEMPVEAAKTLRKVSKAVRHDPKVRDAAKRGKKALMSVLQQDHPQEHIEEECRVMFEASDMVEIEEICDGYRLLEADPEISLSKAIFAILEDWKQDNL